MYVVRCGDGSLYTGITKDVERRIEEHDTGRGARYTRGRRPIALLQQVGPMTWSEALRLERDVKRVRGPKKLQVLEAGAQIADGAPH